MLDTFVISLFLSSPGNIINHRAPPAPITPTIPAYPSIVLTLLITPRGNHTFTEGPAYIQHPALNFHGKQRFSSAFRGTVSEIPPVSFPLNKTRSGFYSVYNVNKNALFNLILHIHYNNNNKNNNDNDIFVNMYLRARTHTHLYIFNSFNSYKTISINLVFSRTCPLKAQNLHI